MSNTSCNVVFKKPFVKCISIKDDICYLFVGDNNNIKIALNDIEENYRSNKNPFDNVEEQLIYKVYSYLTGNNEDNISDDIKIQKDYIKKELYLDEYSTKKDKLKIISNDSILFDDTNQDVVNKISLYCYDDDSTIEKHIYAWFKDINNEIKPLTYLYKNNTIKYQDIFDDKYLDLIDTSFINQNGEKMNQQFDDNSLILYENNLYQENVIYFLSLDDYLSKVNKKDELNDIIESNVSEISFDMKRFIYGIVLKYWPKCTESEVINYYRTKYQKDKEKIKSKIDNFSDQISKIENPFFSEKLNKAIQCKYELLILKLDSLSQESNTIHLTKIFNEYNLNEKVPFMKVMLNTHSDTYFKIYDKCLSYEGENKTSERYLSKHLCNEWSEGYNVQTDYGYRYLHSDNILMFKIFTDDRLFYSTLIIHHNGDIECIIEKNIHSIDTRVYLTTDRIYELLNNCNHLIDDINQNRYWTFTEIKNKFSDDIFSKESDTSIDFMNSVITFNKNDFELEKQYFPNWNGFLNNFIINFPAFFRIRSKEEVELDVNRIFARYKRVNNFSNISTIHSAISMYSILYNDKEAVIYNVAKDYNQDQDFIRLEYESWVSLIALKENFGENDNKKRPINETGSEIIIYQDEMNNLKININSIRSFSEENRILFFLKTMMGMYQASIIKMTTYSKIYRNLFFTVDMDQMIENIADQQDDEDFDVDAFLEDDEDGFLEDQDLDDDDDDDEMDFDQLGGGENYDIKSYYLKRLKRYDSNLFKFKSRKKQKDGAPYGYPKLCTVSPSLGDRQPIVVTDEELERINQSYDEGSGRSSYSEAISVPRRPKDIKYICPKYWDVSRGLSIRPDAVDRSNIVGQPLPKGSNGKSKNYILDRGISVSSADGFTGTYWADAKENISKYIPSIAPESKQLHPEGYGLPCCFNKKYQVEINDYVFWYNGDNENYGRIISTDEANATVITNEKEELILNKENLQQIKKSEYLKFVKKEKSDKTEGQDLEGDGEDDKIDEKDKYISNKDPERKGKYAHLHPYLMDYFGQNVDTFNHRSAYGFLRMGVDQNESKYVFNKSALIQSYIILLDDYFKYPLKLDFQNETDFIQLYVMLRAQKEEILNENDFITALKIHLIHNLQDFQTCYLIKYFRKPNQILTEEIMNEIKSMLKEIIKYKGKTYDLNISKKLLSDLENGDLLLKDFDTNYLFHLLLTLNNFIGYLNSDEDKQDRFILPLLHIITDINVVIFENIDGEEIKIKQTDYTFKEKYFFLYKNGYYYEPILYRTLDKNTNEKQDSFLLKKDMIQNKHYEIILDSIDEKIKKITKNIDLNEYRKIIYNQFEHKIIGYCLNNYSEIQYLICTKQKNKDGKLILIPIQPQPIPKGNKLLIKNKIPENLIHTASDTLEYLEQLNKINKDFKIDKIIKTNDKITSIILKNNTYIPVTNSEISEKYSDLVEEDIDLLLLENTLIKNENINNDVNDFIEYNSYEKYITKLAFQHILYKMDTIESKEIYNGFIENKNGFTIGEKIHFTYNRVVNDEGIYDFIEKLDTNLNTPDDINDDRFVENYSIDGTIIDIYDANKNSNIYPDLMNVRIKIDFIDHLRKILNDDIMITLDKKKLLYKLLEPYISDLFFPLTDDIYEENMLKRYITLCNLNKDKCEYPCVSKDGCKLYIKEKDLYNNLLEEKIIYKFIEKLLIFGIDKRLQIIDETIDINDIRNSIKENEVFYTYMEYKHEKILEDIYEKRSKYINNYGKLNTNIGTKIDYPLKKLDMIPYFITQLYGDNSNVLMNLHEEINDMMVLVNTLLKINIQLTRKDLRNALSKQLKNQNEEKIIKIYNEQKQKNYKDIDSIQKDILTNSNYKIDEIDIILLMNELTLKGEKFAVILLSQKYNDKKNTKYYFISNDSDDNMVTLETPTISFYHIKNDDEYSLSNIISANDYSMTINELQKKNKYHKEMINIL